MHYKIYNIMDQNITKHRLKFKILIYSCINNKNNTKIAPLIKVIIKTL